MKKLIQKQTVKEFYPRQKFQYLLYFLHDFELSSFYYYFLQLIQLLQIISLIFFEPALKHINTINLGFLMNLDYNVLFQIDQANVSYSDTNYCVKFFSGFAFILILVLIGSKCKQKARNNFLELKNTHKYLIIFSCTMIYSYFEIAILPNLVLIGFLNERFLTFDYLETDHTMIIINFVGIFWLYNNFYKSFYTLNPYSKSIFAKKNIDKENSIIFSIFFLIFLRYFIVVHYNELSKAFYFFVFVLFQVIQIFYKNNLPFFNKKIQKFNFFILTIYKNISLMLLIMTQITIQIDSSYFLFLGFMFFLISILELIKFNNNFYNIEKYVHKKYGDLKGRENYILKMMSLYRNQNKQKNRSNFAYFIKMHIKNCLLPDCDCHEIDQFISQIILGNLTENQLKKLQNFIKTEIQKICSSNGAKQCFQFYYLYFCKEQMKNSWIIFYLKKFQEMRQNENLVIQLSLFYYSIEKKFQKVEKSKNQKMNCLQFCNYSKEISFFQQQVSTYMQILLILLNYLKQQKIYIEPIENTIYTLVKLQKQIVSQFKKLEHLKSEQIIQLFGSFLMLTKENKQNAQHYLQLGKKNMFNFKDEFFKTIFDKSRFNNKGIFIVSGNKDNLGQIISFNKDIEKILQIDENKLHKRNINVVIPKIIAEIHDQLIMNLFDSGKSTSSKKLIENFSIDSKNFMVPIYSVIQTLPWIYENGISFISLIIEDSILKNKSILIYHPKDFRILGVNKKCFEQFGINPSFTYDVNDQLCRKAFFNFFPELRDFTTINQLKDNGRINTRFDFGYVVRECLNNPYNNFTKDSNNKKKLLNIRKKFNEENLLKNVQLILMRQNNYQLNLQMNVLEIKDIEATENMTLQPQSRNLDNQNQEYLSLVSFKSDLQNMKTNSPKIWKKNFRQFYFLQLIIVFVVLVLISQIVVFGILTFKKLNVTINNQQHKLTDAHILSKQQEFSLQLSSSVFFMDFLASQNKNEEQYQNAIKYFFSIEFKNFHQNLSEENDENMQQLYLDQLYNKIVTEQKNTYIYMNQDGSIQQSQDVFVNFQKFYLSNLLQLKDIDQNQVQKAISSKKIQIIIFLVLSNTLNPLNESLQIIIDKIWNIYQLLQYDDYIQARNLKIMTFFITSILFCLLFILQVIIKKKQKNLFEQIINQDKNQIDQKILKILIFLDSQNLSQDLQNNSNNKSIQYLKQTINDFGNKDQQIINQEQQSIKENISQNENIKIQIPNFKQMQQQKQEQKQKFVQKQAKTKIGMKLKHSIAKFFIILIIQILLSIQIAFICNSIVNDFFDRELNYMEFIDFKNSFFKVEPNLQFYISNKIENQLDPQIFENNLSSEIFKKLRRQDSFVQSLFFKNFHQQINQLFVEGTCSEDANSYKFDSQSCNEIFYHGLDFAIQYYYQSVQLIYKRAQKDQKSLQQTLITNKDFWDTNTIQRQIQKLLDKIDHSYLQYLQQYLYTNYVILVLLYVILFTMILIVSLFTFRYLYKFIQIEKKFFATISENINS